MTDRVSWYGTARWKARRAEQLKREPFCRFCARLGKTTAATVADHIEPHRGDEQKFWCGELQSLCAPCHDGAKQQLERAGHLRGCDVNGLPVDPNHHWTRPKTRCDGGGG